MSSSRFGSFGGCTSQYSIRIQPITGMNAISCHQPLRSMSCRRRAATAMLGRKIAIEKKRDSRSPMADAAIDASSPNSVHH
jgi:hypothetical protein